jgi:hypothetical protein
MYHWWWKKYQWKYHWWWKMYRWWWKKYQWKQSGQQWDRATA